MFIAAHIIGILMACSCDSKQSVPAAPSGTYYAYYTPTPTPENTQSFIVNFPDANLRAEILKSIGKPESHVITKRDVMNIWYLRIPEKNIESLSGIEELENLHWLHAPHNRITDLAPVTRAGKLESVNLEYNGITDISVFARADMPNLIRFWFGNNDISEIPGFILKPRLDAVYIQNNNVTDISGLSNCRGLVHLFISNNNVTDISAAAGMRGLIVMGINGNRNLRDLTPLVYNTAMLELFADSCDISDISVAANWVNLKNLDLHNNKITDITPIVQCYNAGGYRTVSDSYAINIYKNPLGYKAINSDIPMLKSLGLSLNSEYDIFTDRAGLFISRQLERQLNAGVRPDN